MIFRENVDCLVSRIAESMAAPGICRKKVTVSVCTDLWTSTSRRSHLGVNVSVIDQEFNFHLYSVACTPMEYPHDAASLSDKVKESLEKVGIRLDDIISITTDNESSAINSSRLCAGKLTAVIGCACH